MKFLSSELWVSKTDYKIHIFTTVFVPQNTLFKCLHSSADFEIVFCPEMSTLRFDVQLFQQFQKLSKLYS